jgi:hypothetical protein
MSKQRSWPLWVRIALYSAVAFAVGFACVSTLTGPGLDAANRSPREPSEVDAYIACQHFVKDRFRAPGTAEFPFITETEWAREGSLWGFEGYVDAENALGGEVRMRFGCRVRWDHTDQEWRLEGLDIY